MSTHILLLLIAGIALLGMFILPAVLKRSILTVPIIFVAFGYLIFSLPIDYPFINPESSNFDRLLLEYLSEFIVIISLAAIGIKIDRRPSWRTWRVGWYLLGIAMPLTILLTALAGFYILGISLSAAVLLGSVLAPTDPVLAGNVQVGPPNKGKESEVRFGLSLEAGLNDGLAFPFVWLAINLESEGYSSDVVWNWLGYEFCLKIAIGLATGALFGYLLSRAFFFLKDHLDKKFDSEVKEGIFMVAAVLIVYSLTEVLHGYGFLSVFVAAVVARQYRSSDTIHEETYNSIDQVEQAILGLFLIFFGGVLALNGFEGLGWEHVLIGLLLILIIRPLSGMAAFAFSPLRFREKAALSFLGIRGIGSLYYLAFAQNKLEEFSDINAVWLVINCTILLSILIHGLSVNAFMSRLK
ncbi:cation:proton antiporter [Flavilitoribacter nigricans]|uniref:Cation transporter n=1 Tax=Flavilitoribacter nigricans (strain ATCC 23147 / DSM 23189 / NBRC 102662 / NCIMB 1420 / SS-2) TaxID=1122177 RepID=A0A2D0NHX8_FLAN2|nr:cation:proton antiporter [Flavilitoribacter nigricans]PHN07986.1 cation transporter [Flavilitoribacter nigricans DSM 23189 = NBRC 102662]